MEKAIDANNLEEVTRLIDEGVDVNERMGNIYLPLFYAARSNKKEIVELLLLRGANINIKNSAGDTALIFASEAGYIEIVKLLLGKGADPNLTDYLGNTAVFVACTRGNAEMAKLLLENGADPNIKTNDGDTALMIAYDRKRIDLLKILLEKGADPNVKYNDRNTLLINATKNGQTEIVKLLLEKGADRNIKNSLGKIALDYATKDEIRNLLIGAKPVPYVGKSKSDIEFFNIFLGKVDETTTEAEMKDMIRNSTFCPVCLSNTIRVDGCLYMHHICPAGARHTELYNKYKNDKGEIWWCVDCCRICLGHRHYEIGLANSSVPILLPAGDPFARACDGSDGSRTNGGGSTSEKLKRIARMIDYAFELQHFVGEISENDAKRELTEEVWNAGTMRMRFDPLKFKRWKTDISVFEEVAPAAPIPEAIPAPGDIEDPVISEGTDFVSLDDGIVIQFKHKNKDGVMFNHVHGADDKRFIGKNSMITFMKTMGEKLGRCFDDDCGGWLWPQEIEKAFADPRLGVTDEDRAVLASYKERFNAAKAPVTGGARWKFSFTSDMDNAQCYLPRKKNAGNRTRKNNKRAKKTRRQK